MPYREPPSLAPPPDRDEYSPGDPTQMTLALKDNEEYSLGSLTIRALHTPCHTRGHVLFFVTNSEDIGSAPLVFSGDTLFVGGCGRFFERDASQSEFFCFCFSPRLLSFSYCQSETVLTPLVVRV